MIPQNMKPKKTLVIVGGKVIIIKEVLVILQRK